VKKEHLADLNEKTKAIVLEKLAQVEIDPVNN